MPFWFLVVYQILRSKPTMITIDSGSGWRKKRRLVIGRYLRYSDSVYKEISPSTTRRAWRAGHRQGVLLGHGAFGATLVYPTE
jgi:hypothetical protein